MATLLLFLVVLLLILLLAGGIVYVVYTVRDHMSTSPDAAKAIYDHVFLPVIIGSPKPTPTKEEPDEVSTIDLSEYKL